MCTLRLKKIWNQKDGNLYLQEQRRYTPEGLSNYWSAIDAAIKFRDRTLSEIMQKRQKKEEFKENSIQAKQPVKQSHGPSSDYKMHNSQNHQGYNSRYSWTRKNSRK